MQILQKINKKANRSFARSQNNKILNSNIVLNRPRTNTETQLKLPITQVTPNFLGMNEGLSNLGNSLFRSKESDSNSYYMNHPNSKGLANNQNLLRCLPGMLENPELFGASGAEVNFFGDFEQKFLEANLDKVISLDELRSIAEAIGHRDWGYVKYILTIICLMLKSYQKISYNCNEEILGKSKKDLMHSALLNRSPSETSHKEQKNPELGNLVPNMQNVNLNPQMGKAEGILTGKTINRNNGLIFPEKRNLFDINNNLSKPKKVIKKTDIQNQLDSLNNIFRKMKNVDVQMNISDCWNCQTNFCTLHQLKGQRNSLGQPANAQFQKFSGSGLPLGMINPDHHNS